MAVLTGRPRPADTPVRLLGDPTEGASGNGHRGGVAGLLVGQARGSSADAGDLVVASRLLTPAGIVDLPATPILVAALRGLGLVARSRPVALDTAAPPTAAAAVLLLTEGDERWPATLVAAVDEAAAQWAASRGPRQVLLAAPRSFCAGVERAIDIVERALDRHGPPVYVRRQIVHNSHVVAGLQRRGAVFVDELAGVPPGAVVVFSAHGVAPAVHRDAAGRRLRVVDATCPLVSKVHAEARRFAGRGDTVLLIGHADHDEVAGTVGEAPEAIRVIPTVEEAERVQVADPHRVSYLMQTTLAADEAEQVVAVLRRRFPGLAGPGSDDICYATSNRQQAVRAVARDADVVVVVGSPNSANSRRLVEVAEREGTPAYLLDDVFDLHPRWLQAAPTVGLTAGASAPPTVVDDVVRALGGLGPVTVTERAVVAEDVRFTLPKEVAP